MFKEAQYVKSLVDIKDLPDTKPQVLLLGRSNVGKSTFINRLTNRKNLARVSNTPGKTLTLNFYEIDHSFYLVDAPGYGYAKRSKTMLDQFIKMLEAYMLHAPDLKLICLLIDFKVGPTQDDLNTYQFLKTLKVPLMVVATKRDKIPKTHQKKQEQVILNILGHPEIFFAYSSLSANNLDKIAVYIIDHTKGDVHE